jgi:hypothetical protein
LAARRFQVCAGEGADNVRRFIYDVVGRREILIPANSPSDGVRVAFIVENGAPIQLLEFTDPNHPGRRQQSKMLI